MVAAASTSETTTQDVTTCEDAARHERQCIALAGDGSFDLGENRLRPATELCQFVLLHAAPKSLQLRVSII